MGSAGVATAIHDASALQVPYGEVYASQSTKDGWAPIGQYFSGRTDPTESAFGSHVFSSEAVGIEGIDYQGVASHGPRGREPQYRSYLDPNTSAQHYAAMITMGRGSEIPEWGDPDQRDEQKLENSDRERYK